jgi:pilus assembly protein CpaE
MKAMDQEQATRVIRVAVAAPFPEILAIHESASEYADELEVCGMISSADAVFDQTRRLQPDVLLLSDGLTFDRPDTLARLSAMAPNTRLVVMLHRDAGRSGVIADGVVRRDAPAGELRAAIVAAVRPTPDHDAPDQARSQPGTAAPRVVTPGRVNGAEPDAGALARTVLVFSGKGGIGKSVLATNLATALAVGGARVAMVDLNLQYGDLGVLLHLESHPTSIEAVATLGEQITTEMLDSVMATSQEGVRVLLAPSNPELGDLVTAANLETILTQLSLEHDFVVVDSPAHLEERIVGVMQVADHILLVSSFDITSVKDAKTTLRLLQSLGIERERVALVLNQTRPRISFPAEEVEKSLRFPVLSSLPYETRMDESVDNGRPLVLTEPRGGYSKQLRLIVDHVGRAKDQGAPAKADEHASAWRLRFGR